MSDRVKNQVDLIREAAEAEVSRIQANCGHEYGFSGKSYVQVTDRKRKFVILRVWGPPKPDYRNVPIQQVICKLCSHTKMILPTTCPECFSTNVEMKEEERLKQAKIGQELAGYCSRIALRYNPELMLEHCSILICPNCSFAVVVLRDYTKNSFRPKKGESVLDRIQPLARLAG